MKSSLLNKLFGRQFGLGVGNPNHVQREISMIHTGVDGTKYVRIVKGKLLNDFIIDYSKPLTEIKAELEQLLDYWTMTYSEEVIEQIGYFPKSGEIKVHEGSSHIDIILGGKGSLDWFRIEDHHASMLNK